VSINFITGLPCSGLGLIELALNRSGVLQVKDWIEGPIKNSKDFTYNDNTIYFVTKNINWLKNFIEKSVIIIRCPITSLLCIFERYYERLGRELTDDEVEFHSKVFINKLIFINSLIENGMNYFIIKDDEKLLERMKGFIDVIFVRNKINRELLVVESIKESDLILFYKSSERNFYTDLSFLSRSNREQINRIGTIYGKLEIELEI